MPIGDVGRTSDPLAHIEYVAAKIQSDEALTKKAHVYAKYDPDSQTFERFGTNSRLKSIWYDLIFFMEKLFADESEGVQFLEGGDARLKIEDSISAQKRKLLGHVQKINLADGAEACKGCHKILQQIFPDVFSSPRPEKVKDMPEVDKLRKEQIEKEATRLESFGKLSSVDSAALREIYSEKNSFEKLKLIRQFITTSARRPDIDTELLTLLKELSPQITPRERKTHDMLHRILEELGGALKIDDPAFSQEWALICEIKAQQAGYNINAESVINKDFVSMSKEKYASLSGEQQKQYRIYQRYIQDLRDVAAPIVSIHQEAIRAALEAKGKGRMEIDELFRIYKNSPEALLSLL